MSLKPVMAGALIAAIFVGFVLISNSIAQGTDQCQDEAAFRRRMSILGQKPAIEMVGQFGETYLTFVDPEKGLWTTARRLSRGMSLCLMAAGDRFVLTTKDPLRCLPQSDSGALSPAGTVAQPITNMPGSC